MAPAPSCSTCKKKDVHLKVCAKCKTSRYCSHDCQKADWADHKKACTVPAPAAAPAKELSRPGRPPILKNDVPNPASRLKNLEKHEPKPFTKLDEGTYLHDRPEADVFKLLVDAFRLAENDDYEFEGDVSGDSLLGGEARDSRKPFRRYLKQAVKRGVLPPWWTEEKTKECINAGLRAKWSNLAYATEKPDIIEHYGNDRMPMQLRMLTEAIRGRGPMGQDGTPMRKMMASMENGTGNGDYVTTLNLQGLGRS